MNLQQEVCLLMGRPKQPRTIRSLLLYLVALALAAVLLLLLVEESA